MKKLTQFQKDRNWFVIFSVALVLGIVWTIIGDSATKIIFVTVAFALFVHSGVRMDIHAHHANHDADGHG